MRSLLIPLSALLLSSDRAQAAIFPLQARTRSWHTRADVNASATSNGTIPVHNTHNAEYISNITLGGVSIPVMLDTGSSDLWVAQNIPNAKDTGKSAKLSYAVGTAAGDIYTAPLEFDGYTVPDQAFIMVTDTKSFSTDISAQGYNGLVGLGPNSGSVIYKEIDNASGDTMLNRIFSQNKTSSNFISFLLSRLGDPTDTIPGAFTISEVVPGYENITSMPKIAVEKVHRLTNADQHWQIYTDKNGVIGPDGQPIAVDSIVPSAPDGQLVAVLDSGFTLPQVPRAMSDAIYGRVQGAVYDEDSQVWTVPCDQLLQISFKFGGVTYPVHPLDTATSDFNYTDATGKAMCIGAFQPITSAFSLLGEYDMILGMAFLRNAYTLLDFGDFVEDTAEDTGDPYVQLLPLTDAAQAKSDFIAARLNGVDTTGDAAHALLPASQMKHSPETEEEKKKAREEEILSRWPYILVGCLAFVALSVGLCVWRCCCRRGKKGGKGAKGGILGGGLKGKPVYQPLSEPAPPAMNMQPMGQSAYSDPYGRR
ncbi:acid protease [Gloeophyllum trabeum ATCC 11539]|uniref:Acid protease n=1 Tax=Gloeophyllum trabeum (strain ATCC 11539 / FP-39264 / Madison 617) TaxID=670483 RepID=S7RP18_GLOTA|nr:acid protease [Gloeophyllum trabeum ATCC 11539]EPQ54524.1 acid protease [Gloeophyllum trabeum ATCC 11539]